MEEAKLAVSVLALFVAVGALIVSFISYRVSTSLKNQEINLKIAEQQNKAWEEYHRVRDAFTQKDLTPKQYYINFWEQQNRQLGLWLNNVIPDAEYVEYLNTRIKEFRDDQINPPGGQFRFAHFDQHPNEKAFIEYNSYKSAWKALSPVYKDKRLGKLIEKVKERAEQSRNFTLEDAAHLRMEIRRYPP